MTGNRGYSWKFLLCSSILVSFWCKRKKVISSVPLDTDVKTLLSTRLLADAAAPHFQLHSLDELRHSRMGAFHPVSVVPKSSRSPEESIVISGVSLYLLLVAPVSPSVLDKCVTSGARTLHPHTWRTINSSKYTEFRPYVWIYRGALKYSGSNTGTGSSSKSHYGSLFNCFLLTVKTLLLAKKLRVNPRLRLRPRNRKTPLPYLQTNDPPETIFRMLLHAKFLCLLRLFFLLSLSLPLFFIENSFSYFFFLQHFFPVS